MSTLRVEAVVISDVSAHPDADRLDVVKLGGYQAVVQKGRFVPGDVAIYVPEQAIVPESLLKSENFWNVEKDVGMLAGKNGDRVKAVRLRGLLSQGIFITPDVGGELVPGRDYGDDLGIYKWVPPIPVHLSGTVFDSGVGNFSYTDIENVKAFPHVFEEGENVFMTEKLHGTCCVFHMQNGEMFVSSKGFAAKGLAIEHDPLNFYWRIAEKYKIKDMLIEMGGRYGTDGAALFAEGIGVQDLKYGVTGADAEARFFDAAIVHADVKTYLAPARTLSLLEELDLPAVHLVYSGPFTWDRMLEMSDGKTLEMGADHVREGVVVQPEEPRRHETVGRVILKSISPSYLTRKGEATEYE